MLGSDDNEDTGMAAADEDAENIDPAAAAAASKPAPAPAQVGGKRTPRGTAATTGARSGGRSAAAASDSNAIMELSTANEAKLCKAVNDMLVEQRYVDSWQMPGIVRWLQEQRGITVSEDLLEKYFDRVDQLQTAEQPHILYDLSEKTVHRGY